MVKATRFHLVQPERIDDADNCKQDRKGVIRRIGAANHRKWKEHERRERRKADVILALKDGKLQPGIIHAQIQAPLQPGAGLQCIRAIGVLSCDPHPRKRGDHQQNHAYRRRIDHVLHIKPGMPCPFVLTAFQSLTPSIQPVLTEP